MRIKCDISVRHRFINLVHQSLSPTNTNQFTEILPGSWKLRIARIFPIEIVDRGILLWSDITTVASLEICQFLNCLIFTGTFLPRTIHTSIVLTFAVGCFLCYPRKNLEGRKALYFTQHVFILISVTELELPFPTA